MQKNMNFHVSLASNAYLCNIKLRNLYGSLSD